MCYAIERGALWQLVVEAYMRACGVGGLNLSDLGWEIGLRLGFGITYGAEIWCRDQTLKEAFSVSFNIVRFKEASVA